MAEIQGTFEKEEYIQNFQTARELKDLFGLEQPRICMGKIFLMASDEQVEEVRKKMGELGIRAE